MTRFTTTREVAHSPGRMFDLIADIESYPEFVPLCEQAIVAGRATMADGERLAADMTVGYKAIRESFRSMVLLDRARLRIEVSCHESPFSHMENLWTFTETATGGCRIDFMLEYRFRSRMRQVLMSTMFDRAFGKFAEAFEARADRIYGEPQLVGQVT